jgi:ADP-L-glycero-D-manno-heptose 6-epimerase
MIVVTGAAGFIGSYLVGALNQAGFTDLVLVDDFSRNDKAANTANKKFKAKVDRNELQNWFQENHQSVAFVFHLGARTDTTEFDVSVFDTLNLNYSRMVWRLCTEHKTPLIYASSAATYGDGSMGYKDDHQLVNELQPLNPYGESKNEFDKWVMQQSVTPPRWYGLKFFNVFGPNEYHKGRMASVVFHAFNQINEKGLVKLFRSHNPDFKDGEQLRDFIYVADVASVMQFLMDNQVPSGIYNLGTGQARTFLDLVHAVFTARNEQPNIEFIDTPADIRDKYQYFTEADMTKLHKAGYNKPFTSLEDAINDYVVNFLITNKVY